MAMRRPRRPLTTALALCVAVLLAACGSDRPATSGAALSQRPTDLRGVCPDPVVIQTAWYPEAARAAWYHLLGPNPSIDPGRKRVTGPLVTTTGKGAARTQVDTGVRLEVRAGGPRGRLRAGLRPAVPAPRDPRRRGLHRRGDP